MIERNLLIVDDSRFSNDMAVWVVQLLDDNPIGVAIKRWLLLHVQLKHSSAH